VTQHSGNALQADWLAAAPFRKVIELRAWLRANQEWRLRVQDAEAEELKGEGVNREIAPCLLTENHHQSGRCGAVPLQPLQHREGLALISGSQRIERISIVSVYTGNCSALSSLPA
jgi:hypothetical protein